jgi:hypothetical protein
MLIKGIDEKDLDCTVSIFEVLADKARKSLGRD